MASEMADAIFFLMELVLVVFFFVVGICSACLRRRNARANDQAHPRAAPVAAAAAPPPPPPPAPPQYAPRNVEQLRAPVVLAQFPYSAPASSASSEPPPLCAICLEELRHGQLCSEVPACRHIFHEGCIRVWAKKNNSCPMCRAKVVLPGAAFGVAAADDMV